MSIKSTHNISDQQITCITAYNLKKDLYLIGTRKGLILVKIGSTKAVVLRSIITTHQITQISCYQEFSSTTNNSNNILANSATSKKLFMIDIRKNRVVEL